MAGILELHITKVAKFGKVLGQNDRQLPKIIGQIAKYSVIDRVTSANPEHWSEKVKHTQTGKICTSSEIVAMETKHFGKMPNHYA